MEVSIPFLGWGSPNPEGFDNFIASMNEYHLTVSHAISKTLSGLRFLKVYISRTNTFHSSLELF